jgi:predicted RNA-binding protein with PUA-like domain
MKRSLSKAAEPVKANKRANMRKAAISSAAASGDVTDSTGSKKFLMKTEPDYNCEVLANLPKKTGTWDCIRNFQARNIMKEMKPGDLALFYHSQLAKNTGVYGIVEILSDPYDDKTMYDEKSKYFDPKAEPGRWLAVDIKLKETFKVPLLLSAIKEEAQSNSKSALKDMMLIKNSRLSTQRVTQPEWDCIMKKLKELQSS